MPHDTYRYTPAWLRLTLADRLALDLASERLRGALAADLTSDRTERRVAVCRTLEDDGLDGRGGYYSSEDEDASCSFSFSSEEDDDEEEEESISCFTDSISLRDLCRSTARCW